MFFGFSNCPEICPLTISNLQKIINNANIKKEKINIIFVTLDPERDDQESLTNYIEAFDNNIIAITGNISEIKKLASYYNVYFEKQSLGKNDYVINHTATVFMIDKNGDLFGTISWGEKEIIILEKLKRLIFN